MQIKHKTAFIAYLLNVWYFSILFKKSNNQNLNKFIIIRKKMDVSINEPLCLICYCTVPRQHEYNVI